MGDNKPLVSKPGLVYQLPQNDLKTEECIVTLESQKKDSDGYSQREQKVLIYIDSEAYGRWTKGRRVGREAD